MIESVREKKFMAMRVEHSSATEGDIDEELRRFLYIKLCTQLVKKVGMGLIPRYTYV